MTPETGKPTGSLKSYAMNAPVGEVDLPADVAYCTGFNHGLVLAEAVLEEQARHTHVNNGLDDNCKECGKDLRDNIHFRICKACGCRIDSNGCGCNTHDA